MLLEILNASKKKSIKEIMKKLHEIDRKDGPLEKVINHFYIKVTNEFKDRFNMWRIIHYKGGFAQDPSVIPKGLKDPILDAIYKGTEVVEDEQTV